MLQDIAILTGGEVITDELGLDIKETKISQLGTAKQVKVNKENTIIVDGAGKSADIKARIGEIQASIWPEEMRREAREAGMWLI